MDDGELIDLVRRFVSLYDKKHRDFKNKQTRENAWQTIADIMDDSPENVETMWLSLRNRYSAEKRKIRCVPSGSGNTSEWRYLRNLSFLDEYIQTRKTHSNVESVPNESVSQGILWNDSIMESQTSQESITVSNVDVPENPGPSGAQKMVEHKKNLQREKSSKKRKNEEGVNQMQTFLAGAFDKLDNILNNMPNEDENEDMLFGKLVSRSLMFISDRKQKARCRREILETLEKYDS